MSKLDIASAINLETPTDRLFRIGGTNKGLLEATLLAYTQAA